METILQNAPSWAVGIAIVLLVLREIYITVNTRSIASASLNRYQEIYNVLDDLESKTKASRVVLLSGHDSGDPLDGLNKLYSSVIASTAHRDKWRDIAQRWKNVEVDAEYIEVIQDIFKNKVIRVNTKDLSEKSILRDLYEAEGFECSYVVLVKLRFEKSFIKRLMKKPDLLTFAYLSANFDKDIIDLATTREEMRTAANKIKYILNK